MRRIKGTIVGALFVAMTLTACNDGPNYYGDYSFQMGKKNQAHMGITMELLKDTINIEADGKMQTFEKFNIMMELPSDEGENDVGILNMFDNGLSGGYKIDFGSGDKDPKISLYPVIDLSEGGESEGDSSSSESSSSQEQFVIDSKFIDDIMTATYDGKVINVTVPVSLNDLMFQLYWYGFDIFDPFNENIPQHEHNDHPSEDDVRKINETYNSGLIPHYDLDALFKYETMKQIEYRDYHTLTMGLSKEEIK